MAEVWLLRLDRLSLNEAMNLMNEAFQAWLFWGSPEVAYGNWVTKGAAALVVVEVKTQV